MALDPDKRRQRSERLAGLLARTALSNQQAFAELYRETSPHLYAVALRILRESGAAEEVLQESFVNIWHHAGSYVAAKSQPLTWMTSVVRNRCLDQMRRREVDTVTIDDEEPGMMLADDRPGPMEMLLSSADALAVKSCVERLEAGQKQAIALAFYQGLSHSELAFPPPSAPGHGQVVGTPWSRAPQGMPGRRWPQTLKTTPHPIEPAMNYLEPERLDALAAQYVLGTLSRAARERLARLASGNETVAAALRAWENRLLPLAESLPPVAPRNVSGLPSSTGSRVNASQARCGRT